MTVSIPLLAIMAIAVYVVYRYMGLKVWHAVLCLIVGFLLGSSGAAPEINSLLTGIVHQTQIWFSSGKADGR
jgi:hypothetical protein